MDGSDEEIKSDPFGVLPSLIETGRYTQDLEGKFVFLLPNMGESGSTRFKELLLTRKGFCFES
jgi:hypothetical protein